MTSDRELWARVRARFDELVGLDDESRRARLEALERDDPAAGAALERLLAADRKADAALRAYSFGSPGDDLAIDAAPRDPLRIIGQTVSHFLVKGYLAAGGMGVVYTAEDLQLGRTVALKFPLPHQQVEREARERFVNEARTAAALDHPNLCTVYEIGESEHGLFLAMPLYAGETLRDRLAREGPLPPPVALDVVAKVAAGLAAAHAAGIVHRDLKPANVMLLSDGSVRVLDFGLAKIRDVDITRSRTTLGTIGYIAPERISRAPVDARADLWAVGVMLFETLTGTLPFAGEHEVAVLHAILHDEPRLPSRVDSAIPPALDHVVAALLHKDPADRYQSAEALLADLAAVQRGTPLSVGPPRRSRGARRPWLRTALLPAAALALIAIVAATWLARRRAATDATPTISARNGATIVPVLRWRHDTALVRNAAELIAALDPANAGRVVRLQAGTYGVDHPLTVPDGMTLQGAGVMRFSPDGLPIDFADGTGTTLRMTGSAGGDVLTLGDRTTIRNVEVVDVAGRSGNVVAVASRRPRDHVTATILETVIVNPSPLTIGAGGALGRGLHVTTRNANMGSDPAPDEGSVLSVRMARSVIRSPGGGGGFFAYNFAAGSRILLDLSRSVIGGSNEANGGVSRPDAVHDAQVRIESRGNLYRNEWAEPCVAPASGWNLTGGSGAPIPIQLPPTTRNRLIVHSVEDRIEGFTRAVVATGSRRFFAAPLNAAPSGNRIELQLIGTRISTPVCARPGTAGSSMGLAVDVLQPVADLDLTGAWVENQKLAPGDHNTIRAELRGVRGSGKRVNRFADAAGPAGPLPARSQGEGNRLEIVGDSETFTRTNTGIVPAPRASAFTGGTAAVPVLPSDEPVRPSNPKRRMNL